MKFALAFVMLFVACFASAETRSYAVFKETDLFIDSPELLIILHDGGGWIDSYESRIANIGTQRVRIMGKCDSSCTMFLSTPDVCVSADSVLGFHQPKAANGKVATRDRLTRRIAQHYPQVIRQLYLTDWGQKREMTRLTGSELHALAPEISLCD